MPCRRISMRTSVRLCTCSWPASAASNRSRTARPTALIDRRREPARGRRAGFHGDPILRTRSGLVGIQQLDLRVLSAPTGQQSTLFGNTSALGCAPPPLAAPQLSRVGASAESELL